MAAAKVQSSTEPPATRVVYRFHYLMIGLIIALQLGGIVSRGLEHTPLLRRPARIGPQRDRAGFALIERGRFRVGRRPIEFVHQWRIVAAARLLGIAAHPWR